MDNETAVNVVFADELIEKMKNYNLFYPIVDGTATYGYQMRGIGEIYDNIIEMIKQSTHTIYVKM